MRKIAIVLFAILIAAPFAVFTEGSKESSEPGGAVNLRLAWWGNPTRDERTLKAIELYQQRNPNVTIEPETTGWAGYWDRINTQAAAGNLPDLMQHDYAYLLQFVERNLMADLTPFVQDNTINLTGVDEAYLSGGRVRGGLYGISLGTNAVTLMYDLAILQKAGVAEPDHNWTWADFERIATQVYRNTGVQTLPFFTTDPKVGFENWIRQTGRPFFAPDGSSLGFTDPRPLVEFFEIQLRLKRAGALVNPETAFVSVTPQEGDFAKGTSWVQYVWSNQVVSEQSAAGRQVKITLLPKIANAQRPGTYLKPSMFFSIPASSENQAEAAKFMNFFLSDIEVNNILLGERGVPIIASVRDSLKAQVDQTSQQVFEFIDLVGSGNASPIDPPDPAATGEILKLFRDTTLSVLLERVTPQQGAQTIMQQANAILAR